MTNVATLQTAADLSASLAAQGIAALVPTGTVFPYAGSSAPTGWLLCNGQEVSQSTYADLYAVLSTTYNTQTNPTTGSAWAAPTGGNFRVPDYRGVFLRGVGTASGKDAVTLGGHQGEKTKVPTTAFTTAARTVTGTVGGSDGTHTHNATANSPAAVGTSFFDRSSGSFPTGSQPVVPSSGSGHGHGHSLTAPASTVDGGGDNETRPINKGVNYIIKI